MEMRSLGNSGLKVSALAFGTMTFGGEGHFRQVEEEVRRLDEVSATPPIYPYWHQRRFNSERIPQTLEASASR